MVRPSDVLKPNADEQAKAKQLEPTIDVVLIACSASKLAVRAPARDLYTGQLFRASVEYAELRGATWFIVSARHGLVLPTEELAPYNWTMTDHGSEKERDTWAERLVNQLARLVGVPRSVEVLAGDGYCRHLRPKLVFQTLDVWQRGTAWPTPTFPLQGLAIGLQKAWLKKRCEELRRAAPADLDALLCAR